MTNFCQTAFKQSKQDFLAIIQSDFNQKLISGNLAKRVFLSFLIQDQSFVHSQGSIIADYLKRSLTDQKESFGDNRKLDAYRLLKACYNDIQEFEIEILAKLISLDPTIDQKAKKIISNPTNNYINFLAEMGIKAFSNKDPYILLVSILPCLESFYFIGVYNNSSIKKLPNKVEMSQNSNLYRGWLSLYTDNRIKNMILSFRRLLNGHISLNKRPASISKKADTLAKVNLELEYSRIYLEAVAFEKRFFLQKFIK